MYIEEKTGKELEEEFFSNVIDQYLSININLFSDYLKNKERLINFLGHNVKLQEADDAIKVVNIFKQLHTFSLLDNTDDFDKKITENILINYYSGRAFDGDLLDSCEKETYNSNEDDYLDYNSRNDSKISECYIKKIQPIYIQPILEKLYPYSKWIKEGDNFNKDNLLKDFYYETSKNSFKQAIEMFEHEKSKFLNTFLEEKLHQDFSKYADEIVNDIKHWHDLLFIGQEDIFGTDRYKHGAMKFWIPLLRKSNINIKRNPIATSIAYTIKEYIYIYALKNTIALNNTSNCIIAKKFNLISKMSPILEYIDKVINLTKSEFKYIFFSLLKINCFAENSEINFIITKLDGLTKKTFKKNEKYFPIIDKTICPRYPF